MEWEAVPRTRQHWQRGARRARPAAHGVRALTSPVMAQWAMGTAPPTTVMIVAITMNGTLDWSGMTSRRASLNPWSSKQRWRRDTYGTMAW